MVEEKHQETAAQWSQWAMDKTLSHFKRSWEYFDNTYMMNKSNAEKSIAINGIIAGLLINAQLYLRHYSWAYFLLAGLSTAFAIYVMVPHRLGFFLPTRDKEKKTSSLDDFWFEKDHHVMKLIIEDYIISLETLKSALSKVSRCLIVSWIFLLLSIAAGIIVFFIPA